MVSIPIELMTGISSRDWVGNLAGGRISSLVWIVQEKMGIGLFSVDRDG
jgi:hypothetical protein